MTRPNKTSPSDDGLGVFIQLGLRVSCSGKLKEIDVGGRYARDYQFWVLLAQGSDNLHIRIEAFAIQQLLEVGEDLGWDVRPIMVDEGEFVLGSHVEEVV